MLIGEKWLKTPSINQVVAIVRLEEVVLLWGCSEIELYELAFGDF
jgi:hypothetical protein